MTMNNTPDLDEILEHLAFTIADRHFRKTGNHYAERRKLDDVDVAEARAKLQKLIVEAEKAKDNAYWERNQLVAYLASQYESHMVRHPDSDKDWDDDWRWIICIHTPAGQMTWHIHDSECTKPFGFVLVDPTGEHWDGHTTEEKYERLASLKGSLGEDS